MCESPKANVFCAVIRTQVYGPFFSPRLPLLVTCTSICWSTSLFRTWMWTMWWGNNTRHHYHRDVTRYLNQTFPGRPIGCSSYIPWPHPPPDLTPMVFSFWGFVTDNVYAPTHVSVPSRAPWQDCWRCSSGRRQFPEQTVWRIRISPGCLRHNEGQPY
jgi:hypothetical protein